MSIEMGLFKFLANKSNKSHATDEKSYTPALYPSDMRIALQQAHRNLANPVSIEKLIDYYLTVMPLSNAIDMISEAFASIEMKVLDKSTNEFIDHPVLDLLSTPNADVTQKEFLKSYAKYFLISGNSFQLATGGINRPPLELMVLPPQTVTSQEGNDGFVEKYLYSEYLSGSIDFNRNEQMIDGRMRFRYFNNDDKEIYHSKEFNPLCNQNRSRGISKLNSIQLELDQYLNASIHNDSMLRNQARPASVVTYPNEMTKKELAIAREELNAIFSGPLNTGRPAIVQGGGGLSSFGLSMQDMDFSQMKSMVTEAIYNRFRIPLAMVQSSGLSLANMEHSPLTFYDNAVLPLADFIYTELTDFLMRRYPGSDDYIITYNPIDITAIESRRITNVQTLSGLSILTDNEKREMIGKDDIEGGDVIFRQSAPPQPVVPSDSPNPLESNSVNDLNREEKDHFYSLMRRQKHSDGTRVFNDDQIKQAAKKNGIR